MLQAKVKLIHNVTDLLHNCNLKGVYPVLR